MLLVQLHQVATLLCLYHLQLLVLVLGLRLMDFLASLSQIQEVVAIQFMYLIPIIMFFIIMR
ncbi:MAG: hypothetical protein EBR82_44300 [Caulobacteraceae bacterium]|nr:hypothetical protein [Caulobacteraceae bacterium]